jgi:predicted RNA-binding Zn ribbon-like protein
MKTFEFLGEALCLEFLNTLHDAEAEDPEEELCSDADLLAWAAQAGILSASEAARPQSGASRNYVRLKLPGKKRASLPDDSPALRDARTLREVLRQMFLRSTREGKVAPRDVETLNLLLERFPATARIAGSSGNWTMSWESETGGAEKIFYAIVKSAAELVATGRWRAVRECASDTCTWMFLDTSKNHSRRWCEMARCGNRDKVQRFRTRSRPRVRAKRPTHNPRTAKLHWNRRAEKIGARHRPRSGLKISSRLRTRTSPSTRWCVRCLKIRLWDC